MGHLRRILLPVLIISILGKVAGQQVPVLSQYIMNGYLINPSLTGQDGFTTVNLTVREQWLGLKGGPSTFIASFQTSPTKNGFISKTQNGRRKGSNSSQQNRIGIGGSIFNDNNGIIHRTGFQADYSYHIVMGRNEDGPKYLSMGLALITYQFYIKTEDLNYSYDDDPYLSSYDRSFFVTDFNFGTSYVTSKYYVGFSMTNLLRGSLIYGNSSENNIGELGHFFLTGAVNIPINKEWSVKPSAFIKTSDMVLKAAQLDLTARLFYKESYWTGVSFRTSDAVIVMFGINYDKFYLASAFDFTFSEIKNSSVGSFEITIAAKFGDNSRKYKWLNSF